MIELNLVYLNVHEIQLLFFIINNSIVKQCQTIYIILSNNI